MGSVRGQLTAALLLMATSVPAFAQVCPDLRPDWIAGSGPVSALDEALRFLIRGGGGLLALVLLAGLYWRKAAVLNGVLVVALVMAVPRLWPIDPTMQQLALTEGCAGAPTLVLGLLGLMWIAALGGILFKRKAP